MNLWAINLFDENFEQLSINIKSDEEKFEPEPTFENNINEIKANNLKSINYLAINISNINFLDGFLKHNMMNSRIEASKFEPEPTFENTINEIKDNYLKSITYISMNVSDISFNRPSSYSEHLKANLMPWILL